MTKSSATKVASSGIAGKSQNEREGHSDSDDDGTVSFLLLPTVGVVAGNGRMHIVVVTQLFHDDDNNADAAE